MSRRPPLSASADGVDAPIERPTLAAVRLARGCVFVSPATAVGRAMKTSEVVARDIVRDVVRRGLRSGDSLPHEAAMIAEYGVSRESLREALRLLEVQGLITLRRGPGGGPVVGQIDPANLGRTSTLYFHVAGATYRELFDAWVLTERTQAERAAANVDRDTVRAAMQPYATAPPDDSDTETVESFARLHSQFHAVVASLMDNAVLELLLQTVGQIVTHHVVLHADPREIRDVIANDHQAIARAISAGHRQRAARLMEDHILAMTGIYGEVLGSRMDDYIEWE
jgi:DNA-binding FadR family transcriptional regulator